MRKEYRKALRAVFAARLGELASEFERVRVSSPVLFAGETVYRWVPCERFHAYVILMPSATGHQAFTVEVGWSTAGEFPLVTARPSHVIAPDDPLPRDEPAAIVRLGDLARRGDLWWRLPDPAVERPGDVEALRQSMEPIGPDEAEREMAPRVGAALEELTRTGIPFLRELAERYCA